MGQATNTWGVALDGADEDKSIWQALLKPPFDPLVEEVKDERGDYLVLRSNWFDKATCSQDVHDLAKQLFATLNAIMPKTANTAPVTNGAVVDFSHSGKPRRTAFIEPIGIVTGAARLGTPTITVFDAQGNAVETPPSPPTASRAQHWMRAATLNPDIGSALRYLVGKPSWIDLYKAYEALRGMPNGGISNNTISRFTNTANERRHHPNNRRQPLAKPMELWEARALMDQWVSEAINDFILRNPQPPPLDR